MLYLNGFINLFAGDRPELLFSPAYTSDIIILICADNVTAKSKNITFKWIMGKPQVPMRDLYIDWIFL